ncbi:MAG: DUF1918 domain-containing protein [Actinobacteria bacterium]|nr:DUF1918 domain-containing protein [Actinomycetota bacterium]
MRPHAGDRIVVESEKVAQPSRAGVIEEVLQEDPLGVRVRWEERLLEGGDDGVL